MAISLSGMASGLDTESIITQLVSAYSVKKDDLVKAQTKLEWKQDAWKDLNSKIYKFYSGSLSSLRFSSGYSVKKSTSTSTKATVKSSSQAVNGTQKLKVKSLATSGYLTGGVVDKIKTKDDNGKEVETKVSGSTKLTDMGISKGSAVSVSAGGTETSIEVTDDMTVDNFVARLKDAGVNASFDETNQRFFVSSKKSGADADFSLVGDNTDGTNALAKLGLATYSSKDMTKYTELAAMDSDKKAEEVYEKRKTLHTTNATEKKNLETEVKNLTDTLEKLNDQKKTADYKRDYINKLSAEVNADTNPDKTKEEKIAEKINANEKEVQDKIDELKKKDTLTDDEKKTLTDYENHLAAMKEVNAQYANGILTDEDRNILVKKYNDDATDIDKNITETTEKLNKDKDVLTDTSDDSGSKLSQYVKEKNDNIDKNNAELLAELKTYYAAQKTEAQNILDNQAAGTLTTTATRINGADSEIELNGAVFTSNTNNFNINGLTISVNGVTDPGETISITTDTDVDGLYDKIKDFFTEYNSLINEMDSKYNASSAKGYEPLTDDEKDKMTDKEVEKWEEKVKSALLRRDSTLNSVSNGVKNAFTKSYEVNGKMYSLSSFGIKTGGYFLTGENEKSAYHIDGDEDDTSVSGNEDKLRKALSSDPDTFMSFFTQLTSGVYTELSNRMKGTTLRSAYTVYNDKQMKTEYNDYKKKISDWEEKIENYETRYRKQFTAMEKALASLNSNSSQLSGLLGS